MGTSRYPCQQCRVSARLELRQDGSGRLPPDHRRAPYGGRPYYEGGLGADAEAELWPDRVDHVIVRPLRQLRPVKLCAAKMALVGLMQTLGLEGAKNNIRSEEHTSELQ